MGSVSAQINETILNERPKLKSNASVFFTFGWSLGGTISSTLYRLSIFTIRKLHANECIAAQTFAHSRLKWNAVNGKDFLEWREWISDEMCTHAFRLRTKVKMKCLNELENTSRCINSWSLVLSSSMFLVFVSRLNSFASRECLPFIRPFTHTGINAEHSF